MYRIIVAAFAAFSITACSSATSPCPSSDAAAASNALGELVLERIAQLDRGQLVCRRVQS